MRDRLASAFSSNVAAANLFTIPTVYSMVVEKLPVGRREWNPIQCLHKHRYSQQCQIVFTSKLSSLPCLSCSLLQCKVFAVTILSWIVDTLYSESDLTCQLSRWWYNYTGMLTLYVYHT